MQPGRTRFTSVVRVVLKRRWPLVLLLIAAVALVLRPFGTSRAVPKPPPDPSTEYTTAIRPLLDKYCINCHSTKLKKGSLDLERFTSATEIRKNLKVWQQTIEMLESDEMPPKEKPQ